MSAKTSRNIHVLPHSDKGWAVKKAGSTRNLQIFSLQSEAVNFAKQKAKLHKSELLIHGKDGRIRERNTYGKDPFPPRN